MKAYSFLAMSSIVHNKAVRDAEIAHFTLHK